jgi:hypothetical protein
MARHRFLRKVCYWPGAGAAIREIDATLLTALSPLAPLTRYGHAMAVPARKI